MESQKSSSENENFKIICLVSSAAFSAASCVWPWTAPIGAGLGLYASINEEDRLELKEEFTAAVDAALIKTKDNLTTIDSKKIIDELASDIVRPDNIGDLVSKTDTYRRQYCTILDKKTIVDMFEIYFKEEVYKRNTLSNYYLLAAGTVTLENIKNIRDALIDHNKKLSTIQQSVNEINSKADSILSTFQVFLGECGFVLIAVAGCLLSALILSVHAASFHINVTICYLLSSLFTHNIIETIKSKFDKRKEPTGINSAKSFSFTVSGMYLHLLLCLFIYITVSISIYLIIVSTQSLEPIGQQYEATIHQLICIAIGSILGRGIKELTQLEIRLYR